MRLILKIFLYSLGGIVGAVLIAASTVWIIGGVKINQKFTAPDIDIAHSADPQIIANGERLATLAGCNSCHGERMQGEVLFELPDGTRLVTPNIPRAAASLNDAELAKIIRYGVRPDGTGVLIMPSETYFYMTDEHLGAILSYVRVATDDGGTLPKSRIGLMPRFMFSRGDFKPAPAYIEGFSNRPTFDFTNKMEHGEYLALIACAECHGTDFAGKEFPGETNPPDLIVASAYDRDEFDKLLREGASLGGRDLGMMGQVARARFGAFTDEEIDTLYGFLMDRALQPQ